MHYAMHRLIILLIHAVVYGAIFHLMRNLTLPQLIVVLCVAGAAALFFFRGPRRY